jgi:hypothetical protein
MLWAADAVGVAITCSGCAAPRRAGCTRQPSHFAYASRDARSTSSPKTGTSPRSPARAIATPTACVIATRSRTRGVRVARWFASSPHARALRPEEVQARLARSLLENGVVTPTNNSWRKLTHCFQPSGFGAVVSSTANAKLYGMLALAIIVGPAGAGCTTDHSGAVTGAAGSASRAAAAIASCKRAASVDSDAAAGECRSARALLQCHDSSALAQECLSDDLTMCPSEIQLPDCRNLCSASEYAVSCGNVGPGPIASPPQGCHVMVVNPAGSAMFCCPCGDQQPR